MIFLCVSNLHCFLFDPIVIPLQACNIFPRFLLLVLQIFQNCMLCLITLQSVCIIVVSYPFWFFHYFPYTPNNIATFHVVGPLDFTIMVDNSKMIIVFEHCLCVMFAFQPSSLHISKDVSYDSNNFVSSSLYQISTTSS